MLTPESVQSRTEDFHPTTITPVPGVPIGMNAELPNSRFQMEQQSRRPDYAKRSLTIMNSENSYTLDTVREAIRRGDAEYVQKAICSDFDPNTQDSERRTPLIFAAQFQHPAIVKLLLTHGADPLHRDSSGYDASDTAAFFGEWRMGAYTAESAEIQAILRSHVEPPNIRPLSRLFTWLKRVFLMEDS